MKFLYVAPRFHPNQYPIIEGLLEKGHEVVFCVSHVGEHEKHTGVKLIKLEMAETLRKKILRKKLDKVAVDDLLALRFRGKGMEIGSILKSERPDIVIVRDRTMLSLQFSFKCRIMRIPVIIYNQSPIMRPAGKSPGAVGAAKYLWRTFFPKTRITPCMYERYPKEGMEYQADKDACFLPFIVRKDAFAKEDDTSGNTQLRIIDVGKMRPYKNHTVLVKAAKILKDRGYGFNITILGQCSCVQEETYRDELQTLIDELELAEVIELRSSLPYDALMDEMRRNDVFVLTSKQEVANVSILDAMSCGLAVAATDFNGTSHYIEDGVDGSIYISDDAESLADKLAAYMDDPSLVKHHGRKAAEKVRTEYVFESYYKNLQTVIMKACKLKGR